MNVTERSDAELIAAAVDGSRDAAGQLFARHWPSAWRLARQVTGRRDMADDIAQDAFERAFAALARFDRSRPFVPWLHRIVINRALDLLRSERRLVGGEAVHRVPVAADAAEDDRGLLEAVAQLSPQRRLVIVLRYGLGYSPREVADLLEIPLGTVHSRLARALEDLRVKDREADAERA